MKLEVDQRKILRAFPVYFFDSKDDIVVRRGSVQLRLSGEGVGEMVRDVFERASRKEGVDEEDLVQSFAAPRRPMLRSLLTELCTRRLLVADDDPSPPAPNEGPLDVYYWHFASSPTAVAARMAKSKIAILGVNGISRQLARTLTVSGVLSHVVVDHPLLRNLRFFEPSGAVSRRAWGEDSPMPIGFEEWSEANDPVGCLVSTADFGGGQTMRRWNEFAVATKTHFLPVMLEDLIGYIGPLVVPGETACFECLRARQNACVDDPTTLRLADGSDFDAQHVASHHPAFSSILGDLTAIELTKFYGVLPGARAGTLLEVNLLTTHLVTRRVLKIPRCRVCSPLIVHGSASPDKATYMPGNPVAAK